MTQNNLIKHQHSAVKKGYINIPVLVAKLMSGIVNNIDSTIEVNIDSNTEVNMDSNTNINSTNTSTAYLQLIILLTLQTANS